MTPPVALPLLGEYLLLCPHYAYFRVLAWASTPLASNGRTVTSRPFAEATSSTSGTHHPSRLNPLFISGMASGIQQNNIPKIIVIRWEPEKACPLPAYGWNPKASTPAWQYPQGMLKEPNCTYHPLLLVLFARLPHSYGLVHH